MRAWTLALAMNSLFIPAQQAPPAPSPAALPDAPKASAPAPAAPVAPAAPAAAPAPASAKLDQGLLDPAWFGEGVSFVKGEDVDFFWIKPGVNLAGRVIRMAPWEDPVMLKPGRDGKDNAKATALTDSFPGMLRGALSGAFNGKAKVSRTEGDLELLGRFVDVNAGSKAAKWLIGLGAGSESATWDLKVVDPKTRELLLAIHHRAISGTAMTSIDDKLVKWADRFAAFLAQHALK